MELEYSSWIALVSATLRSMGMYMTSLHDSADALSSDRLNLISV